MSQEHNRMRNNSMQRNLIENDFLAEGYSQAAAGRPHKRPNPSALFTGVNDSGFQVELHDKPVREEHAAGVGGRQTGKFGGGDRQVISIDENEDTIHTKTELNKILQRGKRLQSRMDEAMGDDAWQKLHGPNEMPKRYVPPFLREKEGEKKPSDFAQREEERNERLFSIEIDAGLEKNQKPQPQKKGDSSQNRVAFSEDDDRLEMDANKIQFGGNGGNLTDMRFIRMKIKSLVVEDGRVLQELISQTEALDKGKFSLTISLPIPDIYKKSISHQVVKLNNYSVVSTNEFEFTNLSLYNFMITEETFNQLSTSSLCATLDDMQILGTVQMNKLLMAPGFKLALRVPMTKTLVIESKKSQKSAEQKKQELLQAKKGRKTAADMEAEKAKKAKENIVQKIETHVGYLEIELNLQRGDTEEELERNYQLKLKQGDQIRKQEAELQQMEKRKRAMMMMEEQPTFAQLYLHIASLGRGGLIVDRDGSAIEGIDDLQREDPAQMSGGENENNQRVKINLNLPERNLYVSYKAFPSLDKLVSTVMYGQSEPDFNYRSQFPVLMTPDVIDKLEKFTFVLEVWDEVSPSRHDLVGLVKIPLASFCYSMKTTEDDIFSLNFLAEQHNMYPMIIQDDYLSIYSPRHGQNVGTLKVLLAMGTPSQVNRQIQKEAELERTRFQRTLAEEKAKMQATLIKNVQIGNSGPQKEQQETLMKELIDKNNEQRDKEEEIRIIESHAKSPFGNLFGLPGKQSQSFEKNETANKFANALRQSLQLSPSRKDYDIRDNTFLNAMRKLFEEMRMAEDLNDFTSEDLFGDEVKGFDGSVHKDEFIYTILNKEEFTLTRTEISNVCSLLLNISSKDDKEKIDLEQLQYSFTSYLKYYELIQARLIDLLEKFKLSISKKLETQDEIDNLISSIELHSDNSKVTINDLKIELEDRRGIVIRDTLYDQLSSYFDLDRSGQIYITSFCSYLRDSRVANFNFFKLNPSIMTTHINDYLRNCLTAKPELLRTLEGELKKEIFWKTREQQRLEAGLEGKDPKDPRSELLEEDVIEIDSDGALVNQDDENKKKKRKKTGPNEPPSDLLLNEQVNAKLLQFKLKRLGIAVSLWEIFSLFEYVNLRLAKMAYEPQRYHFVMFEHLYTIMTASSYRKDCLDESVPVVEKGKKGKKVKETAGQDDALSVAKELNKPKQNQVKEEKEKEKPVKPVKAKVKESSSSSSSSSSKDCSSDLDDESLCGSEIEHRREKRNQAKLAKLTYLQVKHVFSIDVKGLKNIPVLAKFIKEAKDFQAMSLNTHKEEDVEDEDFVSSSYIQNVAVKYSFPLDEDEILESDYIKKVDSTQPASQSANYDYSVSMNTVHTYLMPKEDKISDLLCANKGLSTTNAQSTNLFNLSLALYQDNREFIIGNAQLPMEDLADLIRDHDERQRSYSRKDQKAVLNRVIFLYGTSYSQRANCIIGKLAIEITYQALPQYLTKQEAKSFKKEQDLIKKGLRGANQYTSCFMQRETYINRKIPLNALLSVHIEKVTNLKESIENIEHFARINQSAFDGTVQQKNENTQVDRRRILTQILKNGMNLVVLSSVFDEDESLTSKFTDSKQSTRMLYNSLNPIFQETYSLQVQMDTKIFDYLKTKRAVFEVRHYIHGQKLDLNDRANGDMHNGPMEGRDFLTLGYVRVPLLHLITKNNGIDGDFVILDDYKQKMGTLTLRIALNHHNTQRPLFAGSTRLPNQISVAKPPSGGHGTDFTASGAAATGEAKKTLPALAATLIDKSVTMRNSMDINRAAQVTSSGPDFNSRASSATLGQSLPQKKQIQQSHKQILAINFVEVILVDRQSLLDFSYDMGSKGKASLLFLKFKFLGQTYHTKFISLNEAQLEKGGVQQIQSPQMKALSLAAFDIRKTILLSLDLTDQATIESAFGCPLEIQLWNRVTSSIPYRQPDSEDLLGSFFVELNELPKTQNLRVKGSRQHKFVCSESYYTLYDQQRDQVSRDRLALKLYLLENDDAETIQELDNMFHDVDKAFVEEQIVKQLDPMAKGYVELDDLQTLIEDKVSDRKVANKLLTMVNENLEFKNSDSVYYSPLFALPPPYFKQSKSFSTFEFVQQTMRELTSLDSHGNGFLPIALFRSVLEHELKIKPKIVDDFVDTSKQPAKSLDVNCTANSFQSQLDFIVLVRKIVKLVEVELQGRLGAQMDLTTSMEPEVEKLTLSIDIISAMRLLNPVNDMEPPNSFVRFRPPQMAGSVSEDKDFQTNIVNQSCYPCWQSRNHKMHIPLSKDNLDHILNGTRLLEFDVMHAQFEGYQQDKPTLTLIGTAFVDFSALALDTSSKDAAISGYFHIINKGDIRSSKDLSFMETSQMSKQSKGQLKVTVRAESDKNGSALRSTVLFPDSDNRRLNQSLVNGLATSHETFGNRMQNQHMYQSMNLTGQANTRGLQTHIAASLADEDFDDDRERPREEKKFDMINSSNPSNTLTTVNEQNSDFNDTLGALNRDNALSTFKRIPEFSATSKRDQQVFTMKNQMLLSRQPQVINSTEKMPDGVFNPFSSNVLDEIDYRQKSSPASQRSKEDQQSFERE